MMHKERNQVVLVDKDNNQIGVMEKYEAHIQGKLHRAFSVFILNHQGEVLLQQRASEKYHGANLWTNACCSHQQPQESTLQAAIDRLDYEMNIQTPLQELFSFIYRAPVENNLIEHELDFVLLGYYNQNPIVNPREVKSYKWIAVDQLEEWMKLKPEQFTYWFKDVWPKVKAYIQKKEA